MKKLIIILLVALCLFINCTNNNNNICGCKKEPLDPLLFGYWIGGVGSTEYVFNSDGTYIKTDIYGVKNGTYETPYRQILFSAENVSCYYSVDVDALRLSFMSVGSMGDNWVEYQFYREK